MCRGLEAAQPGEFLEQKLKAAGLNRTRVELVTFGTGIRRATITPAIRIGKVRLFCQSSPRHNLTAALSHIVRLIPMCLNVQFTHILASAAQGGAERTHVRSLRQCIGCGSRQQAHQSLGTRRRRPTLGVQCRAQMTS